MPKILVNFQKFQQMNHLQNSLVQTWLSGFSKEVLYCSMFQGFFKGQRFKPGLFK